jgi:hypothetical protein
MATPLGSAGSWRRQRLGRGARQQDLLLGRLGAEPPPSAAQWRSDRQDRPTAPGRSPLRARKGRRCGCDRGVEGEVGRSGLDRASRCRKRGGRPAARRGPRRWRTGRPGCRCRPTPAPAEVSEEQPLGAARLTSVNRQRAEQHVAGLDIAVDDPEGVDHGQALGDVEGDLHRFSHREATGGGPLGGPTPEDAAVAQPMTKYGRSSGSSSMV